MWHVKSALDVAHDLHTIAPGTFECTRWRQFAARPKPWIGPLNWIVIIITIIIIMIIIIIIVTIPLNAVVNRQCDSKNFCVVILSKQQIIFIT